MTRDRISGGMRPMRACVARSRAFLSRSDSSRASSSAIVRSMSTISGRLGLGSLLGGRGKGMKEPPRRDREKIVHICWVDQLLVIVVVVVVVVVIVNYDGVECMRHGVVPCCKVIEGR